MALISLMTDEATEERERTYMLLRSMIIAMHGDPKKTLELLNDEPLLPDEIPEFAPEMSEEEMDEYQRFSAEEVGASIDLLRRFGMVVS